MTDLSTIPKELQFIAPSELSPHPKNPRQGDVGAVMESIQENGWQGVVVVQKSSNTIIAGHTRTQAAHHLGMETVPCMVLDVDDETALRMLLGDNRTSDLASYDDRALSELLANMPDLKGTGFDLDDLDDLLWKLNQMPVVAPEPFTGGYAESAEETAAREAQGGSTKAGLGLKEIVVVLSIEQANQLYGVVKAAKIENESTSQTIFRLLTA